MPFDSTVIRPAIGDLPEINDLEDRLAAVEEGVPVGVQAQLDLRPVSTSIDLIVTLTQSEYDALTPDPRTMYVVIS